MNNRPDIERLQAEARTHRDRGNWTEARRCYEEQLRLVDGSEDTVRALGNLMQMYEKEGRLREAIATAQRILFIFKEHKLLRGLLNPVGSGQTLGRMTAVARVRELPTLGSLRIASSYGLISDAEAKLLYKRAVENEKLYAYTRGLVARMRRGGIWKSLVARLWLPWLWLQLRRSIIAQSLSQTVATYDRLVTLYETIHGPDHPDLAWHLQRLGHFYTEAGNPKSAFGYIRRALEIAERCFQSNDPRTAVILNNLGSVYRRLGMPDEARQYYMKAMDIDRLAYGEWHPEYATDANNIAVTYMEEDEYDEARHWLKKAMDIDVRTYGQWHHIVAQDYLNWAGLLAAENDYQGAEEIYRRALRILETRWPNLTIIISGVLSGLAGLVIKSKGLGHYAEARSLLERALQLDSDALGEHHIDVARDLLIIAQLDALRGNIAESVKLLSESLPSQDVVISSALAAASDRERLAFLTQFHPVLDLFLTLATRTPEIKAAAHQLVLRRKGLILQAAAVQQEAALTSAYPGAEPAFAKLRQVRAELAYHTFPGSPQQTTKNRRRLAKLREKCEELERELAQQVPEVELQHRLREADEIAVAAILPEDSVLVDFAKFSFLHFEPMGTELYWKSPHYLAFILPARSSGEVQMIDLGEAEGIDTKIATFREHIIGPAVNPNHYNDKSAHDQLFQLCQQLYSRLFLPLRKILGDVSGKRLVLSPDGELNLLPFEVLMSDEGKFVVEDHQLSYVASGRDVLRFGQQIGKSDEAVIVADPDFYLCVTETPTKSENMLHGPEEISAEDARRSRDFRAEVKIFDLLSSTREEGKSIAEILQGGNIPVCVPWFGREALEEPLKAIHSPLILHLATHGFFEKDQEREIDNQLEAFSPDRGIRGGSFSSGIEDPLLRSGLALAGANALLLNRKPAPKAEDGILTALDVCGMNLYGTELVTLSACDTGLGEVHRGEGVFGLRREFHQAGAKTVVMSLWKVADEETQILMERFYKNLLCGLPKPDALREAQLHMIREMRSGNLRPEYGFPHPFFWASFICQGDPAPLKR